MRIVVEPLEAVIERGDKVALATIVSVRHLSPRPQSSRKAVGECVAPGARRAGANGRRRRSARRPGGAADV